ncbi:uncharacterized protein CMU_034140 [Cryptosporidium muris RN66]|uniref:Uncharacterized protein n=1 Tax=Cryptosporidium muris (strain RN66) TaxID=441375 RepID=B6AFN7_CRYMR|nr:uncharacterized protein CMU_034140 [Cryptosporidium muris RN66]EEA07028.1 hypothetical protein, conserved [Cryptosporidium muris RN66]|eukprot:XP_002141377.1 hypothetical protein [Cryptosporidium muris RN66]
MLLSCGVVSDGGISEEIVLVCCSIWGNICATGTKLGHVYLWHIQSEENGNNDKDNLVPYNILLPSTHGNHELIGMVFILSPSPLLQGCSEELLLTLHSDRILRYWSLDNGRCIAQLEHSAEHDVTQVISLVDRRFVLLVGFQKITIIDTWSRLNCGRLKIASCPISKRLDKNMNDEDTFPIYRSMTDSSEKSRNYNLDSNNILNKNISELQNSPKSSGRYGESMICCVSTNYDYLELLKRSASISSYDFCADYQYPTAHLYTVAAVLNTGQVLVWDLSCVIRVWWHFIPIPHCELPCPVPKPQRGDVPEPFAKYNCDVTKNSETLREFSYTGNGRLRGQIDNKSESSQLSNTNSYSNFQSTVVDNSTNSAVDFCRTNSMYIDNHSGYFKSPNAYQIPATKSPLLAPLLFYLHPCFVSEPTKLYCVQSNEMVSTQIIVVDYYLIINAKYRLIIWRRSFQPQFQNRKLRYQPFGDIFVPPTSYPSDLELGTIFRSETYEIYKDTTLHKADTYGESQSAISYNNDENKQEHKLSIWMGLAYASCLECDSLKEDGKYFSILAWSSDLIIYKLKIPKVLDVLFSDNTDFHTERTDKFSFLNTLIEDYCGRYSDMLLYPICLINCESERTEEICSVKDLSSLWQFWKVYSIQSDETLKSRILWIHRHNINLLYNLRQDNLDHIFSKDKLTENSQYGSLTDMVLSLDSISYVRFSSCFENDEKENPFIIDLPCSYKSREIYSKKLAWSLTMPLTDIWDNYVNSFERKDSVRVCACLFTEQKNSIYCIISLSNGKIIGQCLTGDFGLIDGTSCSFDKHSFGTIENGIIYILPVPYFFGNSRNTGETVSVVEFASVTDGYIFGATSNGNILVWKVDLMNTNQRRNSEYNTSVFNDEYTKRKEYTSDLGSFSPLQGLYNNKSTFSLVLCISGIFSSSNITLTKVIKLELTSMGEIDTPTFEDSKILVHSCSEKRTLLLSIIDNKGRYEDEECQVIDKYDNSTMNEEFESIYMEHKRVSFKTTPLSLYNSADFKCPQRLDSACIDTICDFIYILHGKEMCIFDSNSGCLLTIIDTGNILNIESPQLPYIHLSAGAISNIVRFVQCIPSLEFSSHGFIYGSIPIGKYKPRNYTCCNSTGQTEYPRYLELCKEKILNFQTHHLKCSKYDYLAEQKNENLKYKDYIEDFDSINAEFKVSKTDFILEDYSKDDMNSYCRTFTIDSRYLRSEKVLKSYPSIGTRPLDSDHYIFLSFLIFNPHASSDVQKIEKKQQRNTKTAKYLRHLLPLFIKSTDIFLTRILSIMAPLSTTPILKVNSIIIGVNYSLSIPIGNGCNMHKIQTTSETSFVIPKNSDTINIRLSGILQSTHDELTNTNRHLERRYHSFDTSRNKGVGDNSENSYNRSYTFDGVGPPPYRYVAIENWNEKLTKHIFNKTAFLRSLRSKVGSNKFQTIVASGKPYSDWNTKTRNENLSTSSSYYYIGQFSGIPCTSHVVNQIVKSRHPHYNQSGKKNRKYLEESKIQIEREATPRRKTRGKGLEGYRNIDSEKIRNTSYEDKTDVDTVPDFHIEYFSHKSKQNDFNQSIIHSPTIQSSLNLHDTSNFQKAKVLPNFDGEDKEWLQFFLNYRRFRYDNLTCSDQLDDCNGPLTSFSTHNVALQMVILHYYFSYYCDMEIPIRLVDKFLLSWITSSMYRRHDTERLIPFHLFTITGITLDIYNPYLRSSARYCLQLAIRSLPAKVLAYSEEIALDTLSGLLRTQCSTSEISESPNLLNQSNLCNDTLDFDTSLESELQASGIPEQQNSYQAKDISYSPPWNESCKRGHLQHYSYCTMSLCRMIGYRLPFSIMNSCEYYHSSISIEDMALFFLNVVLHEHPFKRVHSKCLGKILLTFLVSIICSYDIEPIVILSKNLGKNKSEQNKDFNYSKKYQYEQWYPWERSFISDGNNESDLDSMDTCNDITTVIQTLRFLWAVDLLVLNFSILLGHQFISGTCIPSLLRRGLANWEKSIYVAAILFQTDQGTSFTEDLKNKKKCTKFKDLPTLLSKSIICLCIRLLTLAQYPPFWFSCRHLLQLIGQIDPLTYIYILGCAGRTCYSDMGMNYTCNMLSLMIYFVSNYPEYSFPYINVAVDIAIGFLDPLDSVLRKGTIAAVTSVLYHLVKTFPMIAFHQHTQRLAIGHQKSILIYDLRTATKWRVLQGHKGAVDALCFDKGGEFLASYSITERSLRLWQCTQSGLLGGLLGISGSCIKFIQLPELRNNPIYNALYYKLRTVKVSYKNPKEWQIKREDQRNYIVTIDY